MGADEAKDIYWRKWGLSRIRRKWKDIPIEL